MRDITSEVIGRIKNGRIVLYDGNRPIGETGLNVLKLKNGYIIRNHRLYTKTDRNVQYVENCDMGWC
ncbi:DUF2553 family protein [Desmospora profundinema]|uniref:DUF2553 family protein n=1 Tax=Desmospora profundinema TaxID=1571184 RepID=A0ABU1II59_9BACL|nr:DUF2553 family protein [Desmospora profundinema]MDR6224376.1 hypothetical protein [Desmospora profundinema]